MPRVVGVREIRTLSDATGQLVSGYLFTQGADVKIFELKKKSLHQSTDILSG